MSAYLDLLKSSWRVLGHCARRRITVYFAINLATCIAAVLVILWVTSGLAGLSEVAPGSDAMGVLLGLTLLIPLLSIVVMLVLVVFAYTGVKRDYFERCFPGETFVEQNHWHRKDAFMLYFGLVSGVGFITNVLDLLCIALAPQIFSLTDAVIAVAWIVLALVLVPKCCRRFCAPGPLEIGSTA